MSAPSSLNPHGGVGVGGAADGRGVAAGVVTDAGAAGGGDLVQAIVGVGAVLVRERRERVGVVAPGVGGDLPGQPCPARSHRGTAHIPLLDVPMPPIDFLSSGTDVTKVTRACGRAALLIPAARAPIPHHCGKRGVSSTSPSRSTTPRLVSASIASRSDGYSGYWEPSNLKRA